MDRNYKLLFLAIFLLLANTLWFLHSAQISGNPLPKILSWWDKRGEEVVLIATGDIIPARSVNAQGIRYKNPKWAFENISSLLKSSDLTLINLETPLIDNCPTTDSGMIFCGRVENIEGIVESGVDVVNVANNHFGNYGINGVIETVNNLRDNNMTISGLPSQPEYKEVRGIKFSFLGYNDIGTQVGIEQANDEIIKKQVKKAKENSDVVVVSFHWGVEYVATPTKRQKHLAHLAIDSGADLVIGNHPHWEQSEEYYKEKYIKYAHGNTIFDQMWSEETKKGVIGKYTFEGSELTKVEFVPIYIKDYGQPELVSDE
ncbi:CapA family protein [Patescibacteria group bacterium]